MNIALQSLVLRRSRDNSYAEGVEDDDDDEEEDEFDVGGGVKEASFLGGEGVRALTSTTFSSIDAGDAAAAEASRLPVSTAPERGDSERFAIPTARVAATPVLGGDGDLERGTDSTTFKVKDMLAPLQSTLLSV